MMRMRMWMLVGMRHAHGTLLIELMILQKVCSRFWVGVEERRSGGGSGQRIGSSTSMMMMMMMGIQIDGRVLWRVVANRWRYSSRASSSTSACTDTRHTHTHAHAHAHAHCNIAAAALGLALVRLAARALALPRIGARTDAGIERCSGCCDVGAGSDSGGRRKLQLAVDARLEHVALRCGAIQYELLELGVLLGAASGHRMWLMQLLLLLLEQRSRLGWHFLVDVIAAAAATAMEAAAALAVTVDVTVAAANHNFRYDKRLWLQFPLLAHSTQHCAVL